METFSLNESVGGAVANIRNLKAFRLFQVCSIRGVGVAITLLAIALATTVLPTTASAKPAYASIIIDAQSGKVIYARNADEIRYPASLTKMMTLYLLFEALDRGHLTMTDKIRVSARAVRRPPSKLGIGVGGSIQVKDAIYALATKSANDIATAVAEEIGGTESRFARLMTRKARKLGMKKTTFKNASGLTARGQLTTARDMVILGRRLMNDYPQYYHVFSRPSFDYGSRTYKSHNKLLANYTGTDGIKTGYTGKSGYNLVASVKRKGRHLIGAIFGGKSSKRRDNHMIEILDKAFARLPAKPTHQRLARNERPFPPDKPHYVASASYIAANIPPVEPPTRPSDAAIASIQLTEVNSTLISAVMPRINPRREGIATASISASSPAVIYPAGQGRKWGLQVGAFARSDRANEYLDQLSNRYAGMLASAKQVVVPYAAGGTTVHRARLRGFAETDARDACRRLTSEGIACIPVPPGSLTQGSAE